MTFKEWLILGVILFVCHFVSDLVVNKYFGKCIKR